MIEIQIMALESNLDKSVKAHVERKGGFIIKVHGNETQSATPDFICCYKGYFLAFEDKGPNGKPSPAQIGRIKK